MPLHHGPRPQRCVGRQRLLLYSLRRGGKTQRGGPQTPGPVQSNARRNVARTETWPWLSQSLRVRACRSCCRAHETRNGPPFFPRPSTCAPDVSCLLPFGSPPPGHSHAAIVRSLDAVNEDVLVQWCDGLFVTSMRCVESLWTVIKSGGSDVSACEQPSQTRARVQHCPPSSQVPLVQGSRTKPSPEGTYGCHSYSARQGTSVPRWRRACSLLLATSLVPRH